MEGHSASQQHCFFCFAVLQAKLKKQEPPEFPKSIVDAQLPIFVTWQYDGQLRGCIGTFAPSLLSKILGKYALISAMQDTRFQPVQEQQLPHLSVGVSLLVNFRPGLKAYDWEVGKNGIVIDLKKDGREYNATFLPQVAEQCKWDKKKTLKHLLNKAGYHGPLQLVQDNINLTSYESSKAKATYKEYQQWKKKKSQQK